jgi:hypothetical protein
MKDYSEKEYKSLQGLKTAEEISSFVKIDAKRLQELAEAGYVPCTLIDGKFFFRKSIVLNWVFSNLVLRNKGRSLTDIKVLFKAKQQKSKKIPDELMLNENIFEYDHGWFPPCIYFLCKDNKVVYVGQSVCLPARIVQHGKENDKVFDKVFYIEIPKSDLNKMEREFIDKLLPLYNCEPRTKLLKRKNGEPQLKLIEKK